MSKKNKKEKDLVEDEILTAEKDSTPEEDLNKKDPLAVLKSDLEKEKDKNLRLFAEFENFRKRTSKERIELFSTASESVMSSLLPVLDDFDRALQEIEKSDESGHLKGILLISNKLRETLKIKGLKPVGTEKGDVFNADIHEAITQIPAPTDDLKGKVIDIIEKGYLLGDKIIRFPKVVIGQ
ncbi:MAG: nucleotide exchange factor GrpE [Flavobacteriales bacterium]|nr:MAG: nucleotide exchange factor GrpE [Flavobacteriales bacterium]